jgi:heat shock protein HslJ
MNAFVTRIFAALVALFALAFCTIAYGAGNLAGSEWGPATGGGEQYVRFGADNKINGNGGCNGFFGRYELKDGKLRIGPLASTRKACASDIKEREQAFLQALERARTAVITHTLLTLKDDSGTTVLELRRRDWD